MKTNMTTTLFLFVLAALAARSVGQQYYYYSLEGKRIPLTVNDSAVCIKPLGGGELRRDTWLRTSATNRYPSGKTRRWFLSLSRKSRQFS
jgi:hypothetical protein